MPTNMLESLVNIHSIDDDVYNNDIAYFICQIYQYLIQRQHDQNF